MSLTTTVTFYLFEVGLLKLRFQRPVPVESDGGVEDLVRVTELPQFRPQRLRGARRHAFARGGRHGLLLRR